MIKIFWLSFIPIFVAVDAIGILPIFVSLTRELSEKKKSIIIMHSVVTALCLAIGFVFFGKWIFKVLNITIGDFMIAGGIILFCIAIIDIVNPSKKHNTPAGEVGAVPLGTPLIAGPAVLTTSLLVAEQCGVYAASVSIFCNVALAGLMFYSSTLIIKALGERGTKVLSKIMHLLLAAIAVMLIRKGLEHIISLVAVS
ncbi:MAG: MarC family protein [Candidatus Omnitrophica bacterium]|nr:MarC family protein [Candidatus Omnitrophota bacterium]MBU4488206.1 MarC family protein [Candidatus Omnitrophota bacterium]MCG2705391.1 MarC family protein [Candidatus Omnitrophota bacterium]